MLTQNEIITMNGAKAITESLKQLGVEKIFGYPGGIVLSLYDELYKQKEIEHILLRHEQAAVHAAEGYSRVSGKCGVVLVTSGPGATNTVTGIVNAYLDGYPLVVLTGQVSKDLIGTDAFQEANICDITRSCTKKTFQLTSAADIQSVLCEAFSVALSGKKGPVVVDLAKNIFEEKVEYNPNICITNLDTSSFLQKDVERFLALLYKSSKPVIVTGGGVNHSGAEKELAYFAQKLNIPIVSTMMGLGSYDQKAPNYFGMIGIFGDKCANSLVKNSDLIISLGARFNDRITCVFKDTDLGSKLIQVDINKNEIGRVLSPLYSVVSDIRLFLASINSSIKSKDYKDFKCWNNFCESYRELNIKKVKHSNCMHSFEVMKKINDFTLDKDVIFTSEVGQHQIFAVHNLNLNSERKILLSGGSGTMGFGLPSAIGACVAKADKTVVCICGDGSLQMSLGELATCKEQNLNLKIMIFNNGYLGMVRQLQQNNCDGRYSQTKITNPDYVKLAQSFGIQALRVNSINDIEFALNKAFSNNDTFIIDFEIEPMEVI